MLTMKQKMQTVENQVKKFVKENSKKLTAQEKLMGNAAISGFFNLLKAEKEEKVQGYVNFMHKYVNILKEEFEDNKTLEEKLHAIEE